MATTARRTPSTTSLSKYVRANSPDFASRSLDFCNAFWGHGDGGVDVLFARMRGASRTMEELRGFWRERALIEEEYAKRLGKLAKASLGKDEIGELRNSLDTIRLETDKQAGYHLNLAQQIRNDLDTQSANFLARQAYFKKNYQAAVEKEFKTKHTQESYVNKAREKYEADCVRINSYTAQSTLIQGKDLERINVKLERAQQTVRANEKDFADFAKALQDTVAKWEQDWKVFCDSAQDLEEERMDFMKDTMWAYANAVSTVCVADDESCEHIRVALEQFEPDKDMENFVRDYGTGNQLPDPPAFVNYANPDAVSASVRATSRPANFVRHSARPSPPQASASPEDDETLVINMAGVGSKPSAQNEPVARGNASKTNGSSNRSEHPAEGPRTELVIGETAYPVDPNNDPQATRGSAAVDSNVGKEDDPLAKQMKELRNGSIRRNSTTQTADPVRRDTALSTPATGSAKNDYRNSAEIVVGGYPPNSRPVSPSQPAAVMMRPQHQHNNSATGLAVEEIVADYPRKLPGEKPHSRSGSRQNNQVGPTQPSQIKTVERPVSRDGFAGIGAQGRTPSPSFNGPSSPVPPRQGPISILRSNGAQDTVSVPQPSAPNRVTTPNSVGIALDPSGKVAVDTLADKYAQQPQQVQPPQSQLPPQQYHPPPQPNSFNRRISIGGGNTMASQTMAHLPPQQQPPYGAPPPAPYSNPPYMQPPQQQPPVGYQMVAAPQHYPPPHDYQPPAHPYANPPQQVGLVRGQSVSGGYYPAPPPQQQINGYGRPTSPQQMHNQTVNAPPAGISAAPTGQYTENGAPVLFYVKALYDYTASIEEEFDFQAGDIIAVTSTPEDGWWSGELLDEARRQPGRHVFPSNFVCLF